MSLYQYERDGNAQALIGVLDRSENEEVRARAAKLLGQLDDHDDRDDIVRALVAAAEEEEGQVVAAAVDALDNLGQDAIEALIAAMADVDLGEGAEWVRAKAFTQALAADVPELRMAAANALGDLGQTDTVGHLTDRFDDGDSRVRARAARACGKIGDARATDALEGLLGDPKAAVRREAAEALGTIGNRQALQALLQLYDDDSEVVRRIAVMGFGSFQNDRPVEHLVTALGDESPAVRRTAVFSLVELLSNVPSDRSHEIREQVLERLSATDDETVVGPLVDILTESTQDAQRRNTAWLLGRAVDPEEPATRREVVDALVEALQTRDRMTRQFAATSLAEVGETYAEDELLTLAKDGAIDSEARAQAIFTLGKIGGQETRAALETLLEETEDDEIRQQTFKAISKLGGSAGVGQ